MRMIGRKLGIFLLLTLLVTGCETQKETSAEEFLDTEEMEATESGDYLVVGFSQVGSESDWRLANTESFKTTFTEENGYYLLFEDGQQKQENQVKAVRNFILQEVDYIVLDPIVETGWEAVLQEAKAAGIPVILSDRQVDVSDDDLYTCWVGSDFEEEGRRAGRWLADYLDEQEAGDEAVNIVTLQGTPGSSAQIGRTEGFAQILRGQKDWVMLEQRSGDFTQTKGREVMEYYLRTYPDIDVVVSENDNMTFGAVEAIQDSGRTCGPGGDIIVISFDAGNAALKSMSEGNFNVDFECNPILGPKVEEIIQKLERGETVEKIQYVEETYFDTTMNLWDMMQNRNY